MKLQKIIATLILVCMLSMSIFALSSESATTYNQNSEDFNYEWGGDFFSFETTDTLTGNIPSGNDFSRFCDIDKDGKKEIVSYSGNTITIVGFNNAQLEVEASFSVTSQTADSDNINALACVDPSGDGDDYYNLIIHQGTSDDSSEISFIEYEPDWLENGLSLLTVQYGSTGYYLNGYYENVQNIESSISCSPIPTSWGDASETFPRQECVVANNQELMIFSISAFTGTGNNQRFPIFDCAVEQTGCGNFTVGANVIDGLTGGFGRPKIALTHSAPPNRHIYFVDNTIVKRVDYTSGGWNSPVTVPSSLTYNIYEFAVGDVENDGQNEVCVYGRRSTTGQIALIECYTADGNTEIFTKSLSGSNTMFMKDVTFFDYDLDGDNEIIFIEGIGTTGGTTGSGTYSHFAITGTTAYWGGNDYDATDTSFSAPGASDLISLTRFESNDTVIHSAANWVYLYNKTSSVRQRLQVPDVSPNSEGFFVDLDGDFLSEYVNYDFTTGAIKVHSQTIAVIPDTPTIQLVNTTKVGDGYFGFFTGANCDDNITFSATECIGGATSGCTYNATSPTSQERICTTCGGTISFTCGDYAFANPSFECELPVGNYNVSLSIESDSKPGVYQAQVQPDIPITVTTGVAGDTCDIGTNIENPDDAPDDSNDNGIDDSDPSDGGTPGSGGNGDSEEEDIFATIDGLHIVVKLVLAFIFTFGLGIWASIETNHNNFATGMGFMFGLGISVALKLIGIEILIIGIVFIILILLIIRKMDSKTVG